MFSLARSRRHALRKDVLNKLKSFCRSSKCSLDLLLCPHTVLNSVKYLYLNNEHLQPLALFASLWTKWRISVLITLNSGKCGKQILLLCLQNYFKNFHFSKVFLPFKNFLQKFFYNCGKFFSKIRLLYKKRKNLVEIVRFFTEFVEAGA